MSEQSEQIKTLMAFFREKEGYSPAHEDCYRWALEALAEELGKIEEIIIDNELKMEIFEAENARLRGALETIRLGGENREYVHMPRACLAQICEYGDGYNNAMVAMSKIAGEALKEAKDGGK